MALTGTYERTLDDKQRLAVPKRLLDEFGEPDLKSLYVAPGLDGSLTLYSPIGFERLARKMSRQSPTRTDVRHYSRLFYARAEKLELDSQSRVRLPDRLVSLARLGREVVLLGVHDHAEIWDAQAWELFLKEQSAGFDEMAARAFEPSPRAS